MAHFRADSQMSSGSVAFEGIYDIVPTPRSCLSRRQIEYNEIYDVPRKLISKNQNQVKAKSPTCPKASTYRPPTVLDRSVSVAEHRRGLGQPIRSDHYTLFSSLF